MRRLGVHRRARGHQGHSRCRWPKALSYNACGRCGRTCGIGIIIDSEEPLAEPPPEGQLHRNILHQLHQEPQLEGQLLRVITCSLGCPLQPCIEFAAINAAPTFACIIGPHSALRFFIYLDAPPVEPPPEGQLHRNILHQLHQEPLRPHKLHQLIQHPGQPLRVITCSSLDCPLQPCRKGCRHPNTC